MPILLAEGYFQKPLYHVLEEPKVFLTLLKQNLQEESFSRVRQKPTDIFQ